MVSLDYVAGFLDGEGCFALHQIPHNPKHPRTPYRADISVAQRVQGPLELIQQKLKAGRIYFRRRASTGQRIFTLRICSQSEVERVTRLLVNRLTLKQTQAELLIEFFENRRSKDKKLLNSLCRRMKLEKRRSRMRYAAR